MANAELEVINAICKNKDIHVLMSGGNVDGMFTAYGDVWEGVKHYYTKHRTIPDIRVFQEQYSDLEVIDVSGATEHYVDRLRENFMQGRLQSIMLKAADSMDKNGAAATYEKMTAALAKLSQFTASSRDINLTDFDDAERHLKAVRERAQAAGGTPGISTGFKAIDSAYPTGMAPGHFIVPMGYTGKGKSLFTLLLALKAWEQGYKPMIVSLEMTPEEVRERAYPMVAGGLFRISDMARGEIDLDTFHQWSKKKFDGMKDFIIVSNEGVNDVTPAFVQGKIDTHKPDLVILDYMQLMSDNANTPGMTPRMMTLSRELKLLAMSTNVPIVGITAVTDDDGGKRDTPPVMGQVAWSKAIEYDANMIFAVHLHQDTDKVEILGRKNRHGPLFSFMFTVDIDTGKWEEDYDY
jgi:replicative DNA helicase